MPPKNEAHILVYIKSGLYRFLAISKLNPGFLLHFLGRKMFNKNNESVLEKRKKIYRYTVIT